MAQKGVHILLVEDDTDIREIMTLILSEEGFSVTGLDNGHAVLETVQQDFPDIVLLDAMLGDMDGRDICADLKANPVTREIPIMIVSASHGYLDREDERCDADDYLAKPFDIQELVARVKRLAA
jgi:DNA-binding response OmpR family regulator